MRNIKLNPIAKEDIIPCTGFFVDKVWEEVSIILLYIFITNSSGFNFVKLLFCSYAPFPSKFSNSFLSFDFKLMCDKNAKISIIGHTIPKDHYTMIIITLS